MRHELDQARIDQDTGTDAIKHTIGNQRRLTAWCICRPHTQPNGNGKGRAQSITDRHDVRRPLLALWPWRSSQARAQAKPFKSLVKHQHDVEGGELGSRHGQREADEDAVEDDAEFEDEDGRHLRGVGFGDEAALELVRREVLVGDVDAGVAEVVFAASVAGSAGVADGFVFVS